MMLRPIVLGLLLTASGSAAAQQSGKESPLVQSLRQCQQIQEPGARLACFDRASAALVGAAASGEVAIVDREQVRSARRSLFGLALPELPFFGSKDDKEPEPKELQTRLVSFGSAGPGRYRIGVEDGDALWETTESAAIYDPRPGDKVLIQKGAIGAYFIKIEGQGWVRARRVR